MYISPEIEYLLRRVRRHEEKNDTRVLTRPYSMYDEVEIRDIPELYWDNNILGATIPDAPIIWLKPRHKLDYRPVRDGRPHVRGHEEAHRRLPSPQRSSETLVDDIGYATRDNYVH